MIRLETAAATHKGRVRPRNEDSYYAGERVFAVADGMGGHLAGDVAAATALLPIQGLDGKVYSDAASARAALLDAILAANAAVVRKAADEPDLHGMGTTLTATIVEGRRLHVGHVGDSRAYLARNGDVTQLTRDHTLVEHLIEEGQITKEEAARHPQRSIVTRAIGVDVELDVDTLTIDLAAGDQVLLCSDGLTGPVSDDQILATLNAGHRPETTVQRLIDLANEAGGPDNITVVLLRYGGVDSDDGTAKVIRTDAHAERLEEDWADRLGHLGTLGGQLPGAVGSADETTRSGRGQRVAAVIGAVIALIVVAALGGWWLLSRSFFVGLDADRVTIYHGIPAELGPVELSWVAETTELTVRDVPPWYVRQLEEGIPAADLLDARYIVDNAPSRTTPQDSQPRTTPTPTQTAS